MARTDDVSERIREAIAIAVQQEKSVDSLTDEVMRTLDKTRMLYYSEPGRIGLLNAHGRVLVAILEDPGVTQRALSQYLGVSESNINKSLRMLVKDGLVEKVKEKGRNKYRFNLPEGLNHPDIQRFYSQLTKLHQTS